MFRHPSLLLCLLFTTKTFANSDSVNVEIPEIPLVRCKRPICEEACPKGFHIDQLGCETCSCLSSQCEKIDCRPGYVCTETPCKGFPCSELVGRCVSAEARPMPKLPCPVPMCDMYCAEGFEKDINGCQTCRCAGGPSIIRRPFNSKLPCPVPICAMYCAEGFEKDTNGCQTCRCVGGPSIVRRPFNLPTQECPQLLCMKLCPFGIKTSENGCRTCDCLEDPCKNKQCPDSICLIKHGECATPPCPSIGVCSYKSLCMQLRETQVRLSKRDIARNAPDCAADGTFKPLQCSALNNDCWCVDDTGKEIAGTRRLALMDQEVPKCVYNRTVSIHMFFILEHDIESFDIYDLDLKRTVHEHISRWLMVEKDFVVGLQLRAKEDSPSRLILVEYVLLDDGSTDLPSAANHMQQEMKNSRCKVGYGQHSLTPDPRTIHSEHKFLPVAQPTPNLPYPGLISEQYKRDNYLVYFAKFCQNRVALIAAISIGTILLIIVTIFICCVLKKRRVAWQFRHKKLGKNYERNLSLISENYGHLEFLEDDKKDKAQPPQSALPQDTDKESSALNEPIVA